MLVFEYELCNYLNPIKNNKQWDFCSEDNKCICYGSILSLVQFLICMVMYDECKKENKTSNKDKIEPQHILSISTLTKLNMFLLSTCSWQVLAAQPLVPGFAAVAVAL